MQKHRQKRNYVQNHVNINIILLYGILQITVLFDINVKNDTFIHDIYKTAKIQVRGHNMQFLLYLQPVS